MMLIQRKGRDMDPVKPWQWATMPFRNEPVEIVSYPIPAKGLGARATIMIRLTVGDPTSICEVPFHHVSCFAPDEWGSFQFTTSADAKRAEFMFNRLSSENDALREALERLANASEQEGEQCFRAALNQARALLAKHGR